MFGRTGCDFQTSITRSSTSYTSRSRTTREKG